RERCDRLAARETRNPLVPHGRACTAEDRVAAEALERERRLRLGAAVRKPLTQLAELDRGAGEDELEQAVLAEGADERAVEAGRLAFGGDGCEDLVAEAVCAVEDVSHRERRRPSARPAPG